MKRCQLLVFGFASLIVLAFAGSSEAQWSIGVRIGAPVYGRHYHGYHGFYSSPYYYAPPIVYAPPPVVYAPAPIVVRQPPYVSEYAPAPTVLPVPAGPSNPPPQVVPVRNESTTSANAQVDGLLNRLKDSSETVRRDAAMDLGRMKSHQAIDALVTMLSKDPSPIARDAAARGLGLIASPRSLGALIYAAQADADRDVRHSAQFAVEIIRTNLRGN